MSELSRTVILVTFICVSPLLIKSCAQTRQDDERLKLNREVAEYMMQRDEIFSQQR